MEFEQILATYRETKSIKKTASILNVSEVKVRRVLITFHEWSSKTSNRIGALYNEGISVRQIAEILDMSEKNVQAYLPYTRGLYGGKEKSSDAVRSEEYRLRRKASLANQVLNTLPETTNTTSKSYLKERKIPMDTAVNVLKLHLSLDLQNPKPDDWEVLQKYGKVEAGMTRDILVPDTMTLHALHYVIMKLFGWQNCHLHHFELPEETFQMCTGGMFDRWCQLTGIYFRFPTDNYEDIYWDDDYEGNFSFHTWLKQKYCGPYHYKGYSEQYENCQAEVESFYAYYDRRELLNLQKLQKPTAERVKTVISPREATVEEVFRNISFESIPNELLERLTLKELLCPKDQIPSTVTATAHQPHPVTDHLIYKYDYGDGWTVCISLVDDWDATKEQIERVKTQKPVCVARDGINVLDDVGGVRGFCEFLRTLHEGAPEERNGLKEWSKIFAWSERRVKPENIL